MTYAKRHNPLVARQPFSELVTVNTHDAGQLFIQGDSNFAAAGLADMDRPRAVESMRKRHAVAKREHRQDGALTPRRSIPSSRAPAASYASGLLPWVTEVLRSR